MEWRYRNPVIIIIIIIIIILHYYYLNSQILHEKIYDEVLEKLKKAYSQVRIGDPLDGKLSILLT